jgi:hypothetical protein
VFRTFWTSALFREIFDFKVEVTNPSFLTKNVKPYKTVKTHPKWSTNGSFLKTNDYYYF